MDIFECLDPPGRVLLPKIILDGLYKYTLTFLCNSIVEVPTLVLHFLSKKIAGTCIEEPLQKYLRKQVLCLTGDVEWSIFHCRQSNTCLPFQLNFSFANLAAEFPYCRNQRQSQSKNLHQAFA